MKKQAITTIAKRFFYGNLLTAALFLSVTSANASTNTVNVFDPKAEVKFTGVDKNNLLSFKVKYSNPTGNKFTLAVIDDQGEPLFKSFYDEASFDKTFKLPKSEAGNISFVFEDVKTGVKEKYTISVKTTTQEEVTISKN